MVNQLNCTYQTKDAQLTSYVKKILKMLALFEDFSICQIPRDKNAQADSLAKFASSRGAAESHVVLIGYQDKPSIDNEAVDAELHVMVMTRSQRSEQGKIKEVRNDNLTSHEEPPRLNEPEYYKDGTNH